MPKTMAIWRVVKAEIIKFVESKMPALRNHQIESLSLPWKRLYEIDLKAKYK